MAVALLVGIGFGAAAVGFAKPAAATSPIQAKHHKVVFQVDSGDETVMKHAISGSINAAKYFASKHEAVSIEIVANASGIQMLRSDTSPLLPAIQALRQIVPGITLSACGSSTAIAEQKEGHAIPFIDGVQIVPYGVGRLIDLQEAGWTYIHA